MREFKTPVMVIRKLDKEEIIRASGCWESFDCTACYADAAVCDNYTCTGLVCDCLGALHI